MQQAFITEKKIHLIFDQHLFAWESKKPFIFSSRKRHPQAIQLDEGINFTAILNNYLQVFQMFFKHVKKIIDKHVISLS